MRTCTQNINADGRKLSAKLVSGANALTGITTLQYSLESSGEITIGATPSANIKVTMPTPSMNISGVEFTHFMSCNNEDVQIGIFKVDTIEKRNNTITFTAYDRMYHKTKQEYKSALTYPTSMQSVMNEVCSQSGLSTVTLDSDPQLQADVLSGYTCRDAIGYIAGYQGKNAIIDSSGNLVFRWYTDCSYTADRYKANIPRADEANTVIQYVICSNGDETFKSGEGTAGLIIENPLITAERLTQIKNAIGAFAYRVADVDIPYGTFVLEGSDVITVTSGNETIKVPVMSLSFDYDGGLKANVKSFAVGNGIEKSVSAKKFTDHTRNTKMQDEILEATNKINGASGGYVKIVTGEDGKTAEILIMDTQDIATAVNIWRFNQNGLGHSHNGYNGPYETALTSDGHLVADRISGNKISGVTLETVSDGMITRILNGEIRFYTPSDVHIGGMHEAWENGEQDAGVVLTTYSDRWCGFGYYSESGISVEMEYRPNRTDKFWFGGNTAISGTLTADDVTYKDADDVSHSLRAAIASLQGQIDQIVAAMQGG